MDSFAKPGGGSDNCGTKQTSGNSKKKTLNIITWHMGLTRSETTPTVRLTIGRATFANA